MYNILRLKVNFKLSKTKLEFGNTRTIIHAVC